MKSNRTDQIPAGLSFHSLVESAKNGAVLLDHSGSRNDRLHNTPEAVYIELWLEKNAPGRDCLARILGHFPSQSEATVATNIIQWLGTAVGIGFIVEAEQEVKRREKAKRLEQEVQTYAELGSQAGMDHFANGKYNDTPPNLSGCLDKNGCILAYQREYRRTNPHIRARENGEQDI